MNKTTKVMDEGKVFKRFKVEKIPVFELNTNRKYMISIDESSMALNDAKILSEYLKKMGIDNVVALFHGDPHKVVKIIKSKAKPPTTLKAPKKGIKE